MFNWCLGFLSDHKAIFIDSAFVFAFGNLIVSTFFDIAFHGLIRIRLAGVRQSRQPEDVRITGKSSLDLDEVDQLFNNF